MQKIQEENLILTKAYIESYKSIKKLEIDLKPDLNILIGKNATGKSNFLSAIYNNIVFKNASHRISKFFVFEFKSINDDVFVWESQLKLKQADVKSNENRYYVSEKLTVNGKVVFDSEGKNTLIFKLNNKQYSVSGRRVKNILTDVNSYFFNPTLIEFNIPDKIDLITDSYSVKLDFNDIFWFEIQSISFIKYLFWEIENIFQADINELKTINKKAFQKHLKIHKGVLLNLKKYSPIQNIRLSENFNIYKDDNSVVIENLKLEFQINNSWLPWSQLSDGTKRIFYLISEVTFRSKGLVLVEEPELGIHPHQFTRIMEFLKEQSESKQIIISTHSPLALNHLDEDELDNILITTYDNKKGTQIKHLTAGQKKKAKKYMNDVGFLSDYWMLSDLE